MELVGNDSIVERTRGPFRLGILPLGGIVQDEARTIRRLTYSITAINLGGLACLNIFLRDMGERRMQGHR